MRILHVLDHSIPLHSDYSSPLWPLLMFEAFLRNVVDGVPVRAEAGGGS